MSADALSMPCGEEKPLSVNDQLGHFRVCQHPQCIAWWSFYCNFLRVMVRDGAQVKGETQ